MIFNIFFIVLLLGAALCAIAISVADFRRRIIPDAYLFPLLIVGLIITSSCPWVTDAQGGAIGAFFGYLLVSVTGAVFEYVGRKKDKNMIAPIGMGDIKLIGVGGLWLGPSGLSIALVVACVLGTIWGRTKKQHYIPFAPFFLVGGFLALIALWFLL